MEWIFSGIGTWILGLIMGSAAGGWVGYKIGINKSQHQKAGDNAIQNMVGKVEINNVRQ